MEFSCLVKLMLFKLFFKYSMPAQHCQNKQIMMECDEENLTYSVHTTIGRNSSLYHIPFQRKNRKFYGLI